MLACYVRAPAVGLADMVERGEVNLDDPISKYLPKSVKVPTRDGKESTLRHLSSQISGLPRLPNNIRPKDQNNPYADYTVEQMYEAIQPCKRRISRNTAHLDPNWKSD